MPQLKPSVWGPHYWFFLHTIAISYPNKPNAITKKKHYELIENMPLFIPVAEISKHFETLITLYPVKPYLDSKDTFIKWMHFIHNKINEKIEVDTISLDEFYTSYFNSYKSEDEKFEQYYIWKKQLLYIGTITAVCGTIYYLHDK
jgi:hypothetical protein